MSSLSGGEDMHLDVSCALMDNKISYNFTGGYITLNFLSSFLLQLQHDWWCSRKFIVTTVALRQDLCDRLVPNQACESNGVVFWWVPAIGLYLKVHPHDVWLTPVLADPLCPSGELYVIDQANLPWGDGMMGNLKEGAIQS